MGLWLGFAFAIFVSLLPVFIILETGIESLPVWLSLGVFLVQLLKLVFNRRQDYLYASFLCFFYIFMILAPLLQMSDGNFPWVDFYTGDEVELSWWITLCALVTFELGYLAFHLFEPRVKVQDTVTLSAISPRGGTLLLLAALGFTAMGLAIGGVNRLFLPRNDATMLLSSQLGGDSPMWLIINSLMRVPPAIILLVFIYDFYVRMINSPGGRLFTRNTFYMLVVGLVVAVVNNPISTPRFWVGVIAFSVVLLLIFARRRRSAIFWFGFNLGVVLLVFPISDVYRKSLDFNLLEDQLIIQPKEELITSPDFDAFQQQVNVSVVVEQKGYQYGNQFVSSMLFFVPRFVWPGKAEPTGRYVANELNYRFGNLSTPLMAEFYVDGGFVGVILGMLLLGAGYRYLTILSGQRTLLIACFYCFFASYQFYLLRGSLMTVSNYMLIALVTCLGLHLLRHYLFISKTLSPSGKVFFTRVYQ